MTYKNKLFKRIKADKVTLIMCHNGNLKVLDIHGEKYSFNYQRELWPDFGSWIDDLSISDTPEVTCQTWLFIISVAWIVSTNSFLLMNAK